MTTLLVAAPVLLPLLTAIASLFFHNRTGRATVGIAGVGLVLIASVGLIAHVAEEEILVVAFGGWEAPFGIAFVADRLSSCMVLISAIIAFSVSIYALGDTDTDSESGLFYPLVNFLLVGVNGAFLTGDLFNLYVWFEVMLIASFVLLTKGGTAQQYEGGFKYVAINLVSSALFLAGLGILYGKLGTLNMADVAAKLGETESGLLINSTAVLFLVAFAIKAGMFPFFFWLPASYHTPPTAIAALFAGLLTKVGVYALLRSLTLIFTQDTAFLHGVLLALAVATMLTGVLGAASRFDIKRILSFHIISQIGYMALGIALFTPLAIAGTVFYLIHHIIVKTNLFLIGGIVSKLTGSEDLSRTGGLFRKAPWLAMIFFLAAFSLGGIPPLSGFWAKLTVIYATFEAEVFWAAAFALAVGVMTLFSMTKIWAEAFWKNPDDSATVPTLSRAHRTFLFAPVVGLTLLSLVVALGSATVFNYAFATAEQLLQPQVYIGAVLGNGS